MKRQIFLGLLLLGSFAAVSFTQSRTNRLFRPCPATITPAIVEIRRDGDIDITPCTGRSVLINGVPVSSTITFSGTSRTTFFPFYSTQTNLDKSGMSFNGLAYLLNNQALNSEFTLGLTVHSAAGVFSVGDYTTTPATRMVLSRVNDSIDISTLSDEARLTIDGTSNVSTLSAANSVRIDSPTEVQIGDVTGSGTRINITDGSQQIDVISGSGGRTRIGDALGTGNVTRLQIDDAAKRFTFDGTGAAMRLPGVSTIEYSRIITAGGTTGNQTIDAPSGTVNFTAGTGTSGITVTNAFVNASSIVYAIARTNDATCSVKNVVPAAGSFVIRMDANCTAETSVGFFVTN